VGTSLLIIMFCRRRPMYCYMCDMLSVSR